LQAVFGETRQGDPFLPGPTFASVYRHGGDPTDAPYTYGRTSNPTWAAYEAALGALEGGSALVFGSGLSAVAAVLFSTLRPGDLLVMPTDGYFGVRAMVDRFLVEMGVRVRQVATVEVGAESFEGARLVLLECPSNPGLDVCDLAAVAEAAHRAGALVAVDNTTATALCQQPLALGADFSLGSDTKALTGHSDLLLGHVAARDASLLESVEAWRHETGSIAGPMEVWLAHRSLATLEVRLTRQCGTALRVAEALVRHPAVQACRYPGLPDDSSHAVAARQMTAFGPIVSFTLESQQAADDWISRSRLVIPATSFGGVHSTAERRARWGGDAVPPGFIRMSVGLEDPDDLVEDVLQALA
jgi:cystathionine gamma-lyase